MADRKEVYALVKAMPHGMRNAMSRDINEIQQNVIDALEGATNKPNIVNKVATWIEYVGNTRRPSERENRDALIAKGILVERLIESPLDYVPIDEMIGLMRREYAVHIALVSDARIEAIIVTNYPTDEYATGLGIVGYTIAEREK